MPINLRDSLTFLFNGGRGVRTNQLDGPFVKSINGEGTEITQQDSDGAEVNVGLRVGGVDRHDLNAVPGLIDKTSDLEVRVLARDWGNVIAIDQGGFVSSDAGNLGPAQAAALNYVVSKVATTGDAGRDYVYIRIPSARSSRDYRIRQDGSLGEFFISSWSHVGQQGNFDYYRSRHNLFSNYDVRIQYDAATATQTHYRGKTDAADMAVDSAGFARLLTPGDDTVQKVAQKFNDLSIDLPDGPPELTEPQIVDGDSEDFGLTSGQRTAQAIDAHHTTQHTWLHEIRVDYREPQAGTEPQFHVLNVSGEPSYDRILEFYRLEVIDREYVMAIMAGDVVSVAGSFFTVRGFKYGPGPDFYRRLTGRFDADPVLVDDTNYRLRFTSRPPLPVARDIVVQTGNLDGNLAGVTDTSQAMFEAIDDLNLSPGAPQWNNVTGRPDRPNAAELAAGNSVAEAVPSVSDIVSLVNLHRLARSNADPENVGNEAAEGGHAEVSRRDHVHRFPHDSTIEYDADNAQFGVSVHDVIEHLQASVQYYADSPYDYSQGGGPTEGEIFTSSDFIKRITRVRIRFVPSGSDRYEARIYRVHSDSRIHTEYGTSQFRILSSGGSHHFDFEGAGGEAGILVPSGVRLFIGLSRLGGGNAGLNKGAEAGNSPSESYGDASRDFARQNSVVYSSEHPEVDDHPHSHDDDIRGNIEIIYSLTYNHGRFVGDNFDLSDAVPQPNTTDGSAGVSEEAARADHSHPGAAAAGTLATRVAGVLDITDSEDWVETANYDDTTELVGADRTARFMSWFDGNLYLADAAGNVNTRDFGGAITGMARGSGLFVTGEGNNLVSRGADDLAALDSSVHGARIAVAVQQDDPTKFWSLVPNVGATEMAVRVATVAANGAIGSESVRHTITVTAMNNALGAAYLNISSLYAPADPDGLVDLHVVSASEFWIIFTGLPLAHDLTEFRTVMLRCELVAGAFELVADSLEVFLINDVHSFVRIGDGLVYLGFDGGVARLEKKSARAEVFREHQQDRLPRVTEDERDAGEEDGLRGLSPADVHDMIDTHAPAAAAAGDGGFGRNVLFQDASDRAEVVSNGTPIVIDLDRQPVRGSDMRIEFRENSGSTATPVNATYLIDPIPSDLWLDADPIDDDPDNPDDMMAFILKRPNAQFITSGLVTYLWVGRTAAGQLVMRCGAMIEFNLAFRLTVREILPSGGASSEQQAGEGGRILRTRTLVAADTLIAANNFGFDLDSDNQIALGRYALNPTARSDIFDFVATIRVGSRAGLPIRLSREQFDYVGEYDLQDIWPFSGTGGGSWGNVTEIPCAMLYANHRSEGVVKTQLRPQRQQITWSISGAAPATTVLFFFSYNTSGNVDFVEMIVFTDQVVQIEGMHFHYWEDA